MRGRWQAGEAVSAGGRAGSRDAEAPAVRARACVDLGAGAPGAFLERVGGRRDASVVGRRDDGVGRCRMPRGRVGGRVPEVRHGIGRAPRGVEWPHASVERRVPDGAACPAGAWRRAPGCPQPRFGAGVAENGSLVRFAIFACVQTFAKPQVSEIVW